MITGLITGGEFFHECKDIWLPRATPPWGKYQGWLLWGKETEGEGLWSYLFNNNSELLFCCCLIVYQLSNVCLERVVTCCDAMIAVTVNICCWTPLLEQAIYNMKKKCMGGAFTCPEAGFHSSPLRDGTCSDAPWISQCYAQDPPRTHQGQEGKE